MREPDGVLDGHYSSAGTSAHDWSDAEQVLTESELLWIQVHPVQ
ncbi:hypothetical protein [Streptomyces sp. NPDC047061]